MPGEQDAIRVDPEPFTGIKSPFFLQRGFTIKVRINDLEAYHMVNKLK